MPSLSNTPLVKMLASVQKSLDNLNARFPGVARGSVRATIRDVDDPQNRGRVRVLFDAMNYKDIPQVEGAGEYSNERDGEEEYLSHWIDVSPAFAGKQPKGLLGKRVNIQLSNGQYQYAVLQDVVHDPELLTSSSAAALELPNNSSMTRLPVYNSGELPPASKENVGCTLIETGGPQGDDWLMVCLKRGGSYKWVRHIDRLHYHTGQVPDNDNEDNGPDKQGRTYDSTIQTTAGPLEGSD